MPDEASTPPADTQAPPSEPVTPPAAEPQKSEDTAGQATPPPEAAAPAPEPTQTETPTPTEAPSSVQDYGRAQQAYVAEPEPLSQNETGTGKSVPEPTPEPQQSNPQPRQSNSVSPTPVLHGDIAKARAAMQDQKRKKLDKIMAKLTEKSKITNDEVEKLLHVSDATATRYLQALEKENKIKQTGSTGVGVFYEKI